MTSAEQPPALPVLLYHSVNDDPPAWIAQFTVGTRTFARQMELIEASGRIPVTARQVVNALHGGEPLPEWPILITFDDAFRDFVDHAMPELAARNLPATMYVTTGALDPHNASLLPPARMMTMKQVVMAADAGIEIGAHSHTHPQLDTVSKAAVIDELERSKAELEDVLGEKVATFAYPHGYSSRAVRELARRCGYEGAFAVRNALSSAHDDPFRIARLMLRADTGFDEFAGWLGGTGARVAPYGESAATKLWRAYRKTRSRARLPQRR